MRWLCSLQVFTPREPCDSVVKVQATYLSWSVQCCPNNSFGKWQIQLSFPTSTSHGRQADSSVKVQYPERIIAKTNKQPNNNIWKMASPALLPNITLPFILPPVNLSTIYQGEKKHSTNFYEKATIYFTKLIRATFEIILSRWTCRCHWISRPWILCWRTCPWAHGRLLRGIWCFWRNSLESSWWKGTSKVYFCLLGTPQTGSRMEQPLVLSQLSFRWSLEQGLNLFR